MDLNEFILKKRQYCIAKGLLIHCQCGRIKVINDFGVARD